MGFGGSGGSGSGSISGASDAALSNPANNDVLTYDSGVAKWKNAPVTGGGGAGSPDAVQRVIYNEATNSWPARPADAVYVEWVGGSSLTPPVEAVVNIDTWVRQAELV